MADLIYATNPSSIVRFLQHIPTAGRPDKVTVRYLESVGFKSKADRYIITILRTLGFIDASQVPTARWMAYRDRSKSKEVLGEAMQSAYADLFKTFPDAYRREPDTIRNFFSSKSSLKDSTIRLAVLTFRSLAAEATFNGVAAPKEREDDEFERDSGGDGDSRPKTKMPSLSVAVQVYIDKEMTAEQVDHVFASMAKHLYGKE